MNGVGNGITVAAGVLALLMAAIAHGFPQPKWWPNAIPWPVEWGQVALVIGGCIGIVGGKIGHGINTAVTWINDSAARLGWVSLVGVGLMTVLAIAAAGFLVKRLVKKQFDTRTLTLAGSLPFIAASIPGSIGAGFVWVLGGIAVGVSWFIGLCFGI